MVERNGAESGVDMGKNYSVKEVADLFSVCKNTVYKWMDADEDGSAVIPPDGWFRTPGGQFRIRPWVVEMLMEG